MRLFAQFFFVCAVCLTLAATASAQVAYTSDLDDGTGWTIVADDDTASEFGFDYSPFGIPPAPNGTGTTGLKMAANIVDPGAPAYISATPDGVSMSGKYTVQYDFWINFNSSGGTTEFAGGFVGFDASVGNPRSGAGYLGDSDGDSARDHALYKDANEQFVESEQYDVASNNNTDPDLSAAFPGQTTPAAQGAAPFSPTNVIVTAPNGSLGYGWHTMLVTVDSDAGTANFSIDDFSIGTVDSNIGDPVNLAGGIALTFADTFNSVSTKPEFSFGVFDNLVVSQVPEPSSLILLCGFFGALLLRRR